MPPNDASRPSGMRGRRAAGRLRWLALYPALCLTLIGADVVWAVSGPASEGPRRGVGAGWFAFLALATLPGYGVAVVALAARVRRLGPRGARTVAGIAAVVTPVLWAAVLALPSHVYVAHPSLADALAFVGPWVAGAAGPPLAWLVTRGLVARRAGA